MLYFKNVELSREYHVSLGTIRNWIQAAQNEKLDLILHSKGDKLYIANTASNVARLEQLTRHGKKYRPRRTQRTLVPHPEFYALYSQAQIYDIITNIEVHREIPRQYSYFDSGAKGWDEYIRRMEQETTPSNLTMTRRLLAVNRGYVDEILKSYRKINVIDVGVGNALPVKDLLTHLLEMNTLARYVAIDISPAMLEIAKSNIHKWFDKRVNFEGYAMDISRDSLTGILANSYAHDDQGSSCNLILFLGGTLQNFRKRDVPLQIINDSMNTDDLLVHTQKLDSSATRQHFDFSNQPGKQAVPDMHGLVLKLLNLDSSLYELELGYDEKRHERYERIRFKLSVKIEFDLKVGKRIVNLEKDESLLIWRASQDSATDIANMLDRNDFYPLQISQTDDQEYILTLSRVKRD